MAPDPAALDPGQVAWIEALLQADAWRWEVLCCARSVALSDWAIAAGFVRNAVWDKLHGLDASTPLDDIDLIFFDPTDLSKARETEGEAVLSDRMPGVPWSLRNQARMHWRNGDAPYRDTAHAMAHWLETVTPVGARLEADDSLTLLAPLGLGDLFAMRCRPTPAGKRRHDQYRARMLAKDWPGTWPKVTVEGLSEAHS